MPHTYIIKKLKRFFVYRVLHVDDTPHRIALGLAIGIFVTWTPTMGAQMALTIALATLLKANKFVGVPFVWISNPVTAVPLYGGNFMVGTWLLPGEYSLSKFTDAVSRAAFSGGGPLDQLDAWWNATAGFFWPLWVGSLVVALVLGLTTYILTRWTIVRYRKMWHKHHPDAKPLASDDFPAPPNDASPGAASPAAHKDRPASANASSDEQEE